jgi:hypothetical protein
MAKSSTIEPINIELYEKAWTHNRSKGPAKTAPQHRIKKQPNSKKKTVRKRKTKK